MKFAGHNPIPNESERLFNAFNDRWTRMAVNPKQELTHVVTHVSTSLDSIAGHTVKGNKIKAEFGNIFRKSGSRMYSVYVAGDYKSPGQTIFTEEEISNEILNFGVPTACDTRRVEKHSIPSNIEDVEGEALYAITFPKQIPGMATLGKFGYTGKILSSTKIISYYAKKAGIIIPDDVKGRMGTIGAPKVWFTEKTDVTDRLIVELIQRKLKHSYEGIAVPQIIYTKEGGARLYLTPDFPGRELAIY